MLENVQQKHQIFEAPDIDTTLIRQKIFIIGYKDLLQGTQFQNNFLQNLTLNDNTIPQIKVFARFLLKYFRFNYQLIWVQRDQSAYINVPTNFS